MAALIALIPAAGTGERFGAKHPKQYHVIAGKTLLEHTVNSLLTLPALQMIAVVVAPDDMHIDAIKGRFAPQVVVLREGGSTRAATVQQGIAALLKQQLATPDDWLLVHDAARCCVSTVALERLVKALDNHPVGGLLALPVTDTVKRASGLAHVNGASGQVVECTISREGLWLAQTPQMFRVHLLQQALAPTLPAGSVNTLQHQDVTSGVGSLGSAGSVGVGSPMFSDEAVAIEALGLQPQLVLGEARNLKVTHPEDVALAEFWLQSAYNNTV